MRYLECRIVYVDPSRYMLDAISIDRTNWFEDVTYVNTGLKQSGDILHPEIGDVVVLNLVEDGLVEFVKFYSPRRTNSDGLPTNLVGKGTVGTDLPGDRNFTGPDGAFLRLLRGGAAMVGASPLAQTVYLALEGMVRTVAQNYELMSAGTRIYSVNDGGNIITRMCFNSSEKFFSANANANSGAEAENFEFQIDFGASGFNLFAGEIGDDGKRQNYMSINIKQSGDMRVICGSNITFDLYSNGGLSLKLVDDDNNLVYNKTIATALGSVLLKEVITGDVVRYIDGNVFEEVTGTHNVKASVHQINAAIIDHNSNCMRNSTGINIDEVAAAPNSGITLK